MNTTLKRVLTNARIITLIIFLILAVVAINPQWNAEGAAIRSIQLNSSAAIAGIENPKPTISPTSREIIIALNNVPVKTMQEYLEITKNLIPNQSIMLQTNKGLYTLKTKPLLEVIGYENVTREEVVQDFDVIPLENVSAADQANQTGMNQTQSQSKNITKNVTRENVTREVPITKIIGTEPLGLSVSPAPSSNLRKGLDLQGGTRVLLQPEEEISNEDLSMVIENMKERLNVYGLSDVIIRAAGDLSGNQYILVEIAGANEEEVKELLAKQGKFEAKISNATVFKGGNDITYVCRSADCSGIDPRVGCSQNAGSWFCGFQFSISLSPEAAQSQADATAKLNIIRDANGDPILSDKIFFYLDDQEVDALQIGAELRGRPTTEISIRGSGTGISEADARVNTLESMKRLQTVLTTGSLPVKMKIVKTDNLSAALGEQFTKNVFVIALAALLGVCAVILIVYRTWKVAVAVIITLLSEVTLVFGLAALIGWNLDLAAIAGIIVSLGTGVDDQIVITDETISKIKDEKESWLKRFRKAFFIIMAAYACTFVAMIPLLFAGAGLLKGFALTTIMGVSFGVFITRPAYSAFLQILFKE